MKMLFRQHRKGVCNRLEGFEYGFLGICVKAQEQNGGSSQGFAEHNQFFRAFRWVTSTMKTNTLLIARARASALKSFISIER